MLFELYNEAGQLILDNEMKVLKTVKVERCSGHIEFLDYRTPPNVWCSDWSIAGRVAGTNQGVEMVTNPIINGGASINSEVSWVRPLDGSAALTSQVLSGVAATSNWDVIGPGVEFAHTAVVTPADTSGYFDCYNPQGELVWSLSALLNVPQILGAFDTSVTTSINLLDYPANVRERLFFTTPQEGIYEIPGEGMATYYAVQVARQGNRVNFGKIYNDGALQEVVMMAYIP